MDHNLLWCATAVVAKLTLKYTHETSCIQRVSVIDTKIHENIYEYHVFINTVGYYFKYTFDNNTFVRGKLEICRNNKEFKTFVIKRDMNGFKIYLSIKEYIEFYSFNNRQILGIRIMSGKKETVTSFTITKSEDVDVNQEEYLISIIHFDNYKTDIKNIDLHMALFTVNGVGNKDFYRCHDVMSINTNNLSLIVFSTITGQVICTDFKGVCKDHERFGHIVVINSDFNQEYEYTYNDSNNLFFIQEIVSNRHNEQLIKDKISYREVTDTIYINEEKVYHVKTTNDRDVVFTLV